MAIKKTKLLVAELKVIAFSLSSKHCKQILLDAAQRLEDTDKIAEFYRQKAEVQGDGNDGFSTKLRRLPILPWRKK